MVRTSGLGGASDGRAAIGSGVGPGEAVGPGTITHGADHEGRHQDDGEDEAADGHGPGGGGHGGPGSRDLGHAQTLPDHSRTNIRTMVPRSRRTLGDAPRGTIGRDRRARGGLGPDPSTRHGTAPGADVRRRDHRDRAVHRPVDGSLRDRQLGAGLGVGGHRRPAGGPALWPGARRRPVDPGPVPAARPLVEAARGARCPVRRPAPGGGRLHRPVPVQAAERQPAVPRPAVPGPGAADHREPERHPR